MFQRLQIALVLRTRAILVVFEKLTRACFFQIARETILLPIRNLHHFQKWCKFLHVIQKYTKFAKFAGLYFPHFTTFRDKTLQFYTNFKMHALSSCSDGFCFSCLDQNLVYSWNHPLLMSESYHAHIDKAIT